jgi:hypothetical protein
MMRRLIGILEDVRETQRVHSSMLQNLMRQGVRTDDPVALPEGVSFPLKSIEEFQEMELRLADPTFLNGIVSIPYIHSIAVIVICGYGDPLLVGNLSSMPTCILNICISGHH